MAPHEDGQATAGDETGSRSSHGTGVTGGMSETSSQRDATARLQKRAGPGHDGEEDLLEQKRSLQDGVFACMYTLVKQSALTSWKFMVIKIVMEGLMNFLVAFNPAFRDWDINTNLWIWKIVRWALWRSPIMRLYGYDTYIKVMYVMAGMVFACLAGLLWLTLAMRKQEQSKALKRAAWVLNLFYDIIFGICYVAFFDYFVFTANCRFGSGNAHNYFKGVMCLEMPHLLHMLVACVTALVVFLITAMMVVASCDLNPVSRGWMASPAAYARIKILCAKAIYIICSDCLSSIPKPQSIFMAIAAGAITWWNFKSIPFYRNSINMVWSGMWLGILFTTIMLCVTSWEHDQSAEMRTAKTMDVLYGIFPVVAGGIVIQWLHIWYMSRPAKKFKDLAENVKLKTIHKFESVGEVEILARCMRKWDDDGEVLEEGSALGEIIIKAGMQTYPNQVMLLILYANYLMEVRKDGPASRTQLQIASKHSPTIVERYQIFCTVENSKRLKDAQEGGMDLQAYVEFKRNYRAVIRVHKEVLQMQCDFWKLLLKNEAYVSEIDKAMAALEDATGRANQVYKRVMERYPNNGKLLRCYGKFLEEVRNDPMAATRVYAEASRAGGGDMLLNLDANLHNGNKPDFLTSMDMGEDAVVVINAEGTIMMVNQGMTAMFGYPKIELEGANVSVLMPQPFSGRHTGYIQRYTTTGASHLLDTVCEMVALHKERYVFPVVMCVTKLSGIGTDSIFMAVIRPMTLSKGVVRVWVAPNGTILCADQQFSSLCGLPDGDLVGRNVMQLTSEHEALEQLLDQCRTSTVEEFAAGTVRGQLAVAHKYLEPVPVDVTVTLGGTDSQRIFMMGFQRKDGQEGTMLVVDVHLRINFATWDVCAMTGYPSKVLLKMRLSELLPPPFNSMHAKWIKDPPSAVPPTSCRAGVVVHLLNETGTQVPVRLAIRSHEDSAGGGTKFVVQMKKVPPEAFFSEKRITLKVGFNTIVRSVEDPDNTTFGFATGALVGRSLCDFVDIFDDWKAKQGEKNLQLFLLALLDKEQEMPGCSWRVRVNPPHSQTGQVVALPSVAGASAPEGHHAASKKASKPACMQLEVEEGDESDSEDQDLLAAAGSTGHGPCVRVVLWRRELLTGVLELDSDLVIRKANPLMGYIVGLPNTVLLKKPLSKYLEIPSDASWSQLMCVASQKKGALKTGGSAAKGAISAVKGFLGPHIDAGTMRLLLQGVQADASDGNKITVMIHPDITFQGAHANLMKVLKLDGSASEGAAAHGGARSAATSRAVSPSAVEVTRNTSRRAPRETEDTAADFIIQPRADAPAAEGEASAAPAAKRRSLKASAEGGEADAEGDDEGDDKDSLEDDEATALHRRANTQSEFVASWVRTISKQASQLPEASGPGGACPDPRVAGAGGLAPIGEDGEEGAGAGGGDAAAKATSADAIAVGAGALERDGGSVSPAEIGKQKKDEQDWEKGSEGGNSSASESQGNTSVSGLSAATSGMESEMVVDMRRGKLLKSLQKLMLGPILTAPLYRLRTHTYVLLLVMLVTHIVCYIVFKSMIQKENTNVDLVYGQAMAMDRAQLSIVRCLQGAFCTRPNVTKVDVCSAPLSLTVERLEFNAHEVERNHQGVYLGFNTVRKLGGELYTLWTEPKLEYQVFYDTDPPQTKVEKGGLWHMGNAYIAAIRESLFWLPHLEMDFKFHRAYKFILANGIGSLFAYYSESLDMLVLEAWNALDTLQVALITLLVIEALVIQLACTAYQWWLIQQVEAARLVGLLAMLGLPGPVLRGLASKEVKVLDDSDAESDAGSILDEDEGKDHAQQEKHAAGPKAAAAGDKGKHVEGGGKAGEGGGSAAHQASFGSGAEGVEQEDTGQLVAEGTGGSEPMLLSGGDDAGKQGELAEGTSSGGAGAAGRKGKSRRRRGSGLMRGSTLTINGKTLVRSYWNVSKFMVPFAVWNLCLVIIYAISLVKLKDMQGPLASLNMAGRVIYRYTRVRAVAMAAVSQDDVESTRYWQEMLHLEVHNLESEYDTLMYGGMAITQANSVFTHEVPASTFASAEFTNKFFKTTACLRFDKSTCYTADNEYYEVTHHGLDVMMRRVISEMRLLSEDDPSDVTYNSTRYNLMFWVGTKDLYEGLQQAAELFVSYSISRYNAITQLHTILMVITVLLVCAYLFFMLRPHLARVVEEAKRQCGLLSHVPHEMDVRGHIKAVFNRTNNKKDASGNKKGGRGLRQVETVEAQN